MIDQDGGEGHVGTIISLVRLYEEGLPLDEATVEVCWDNGNVAVYSVGMDGHDLRLLDSSPSGMFILCLFVWSDCTIFEH